MVLRRSPTLELAAAVEAARSAKGPAYSLSTPTFRDRARDLNLADASTLLTPPYGLDALRAEAEKALRKRWALPHHELLITSGAKAAILSVLRASCDAGEAVIILAPAWPSYADIVQLLYLQPFIFETELESDFAVDSDRLAAKLRQTGAKAVLLSNPNNPTGKILSGPELQGICEVSRTAGATVVIDESFSGVVFDHEKWSGSVCDDYERLVVVNSYSKSHHLQGLRVGFSAARGALYDEVLSAHQTGLSSASSLSQAAVLALLRVRDNHYDYSDERALALGFVEGQGWDCYPAEGSFYVFPKVADIELLAEAAGEQGLFMLRGHAFGESYGAHFRLCFGKPLAELDAIFAILAQCVDKVAART